MLCIFVGLMNYVYFSFSVERFTEVWAWLKSLHKNNGQRHCFTTNEQPHRSHLPAVAATSSYLEKFMRAAKKKRSLQMNWNKQPLVNAPRHSQAAGRKRAPAPSTLLLQILDEQRQLRCSLEQRRDRELELHEQHLQFMQCQEEREEKLRL